MSFNVVKRLIITPILTLIPNVATAGVELMASSKNEINVVQAANVSVMRYEIALHVRFSYKRRSQYQWLKPVIIQTSKINQIGKPIQPKNSNRS